MNFVPAKLAKEKGFDLNSHAFYGCDNPEFSEPNQLTIRDWVKWTDFGKQDSPQKGTKIYSAPTQSLLRKWLREEKERFIQVFIGGKFNYGYYIHNLNSKDIFEDAKNRIFHRANFDTYEEALEAGLIEALKLLK